MNKTRALFFVALLMIVTRAGAAEMTIRLNGEGEAASISTDETEGTFTVTVSSGSLLAESFTIGNASFHPEDVQRVVLCSGCEETYFIPASDRSSTYGATTGLILWARGCCGEWWGISVLPLKVAGIKGPDAEGLTSIIDAQNPEKLFSFREGILIEETPPR